MIIFQSFTQTSRSFTHEELRNLTEEELQIEIQKSMGTVVTPAIKKKPKPPLSRAINETCGVWCRKCNSTMTRINFWNPFSERTCDNKKCENSIKRQK